MTYFCYIWAPFCISGAGSSSSSNESDLGGAITLLLLMGVARHFKFGTLFDHGKL